MLSSTTEALETSKSFLKDSIELTNLMLKQKLEAARRGEEVDWKEAREIMDEGRKCSRQLQQAASLETRDRNVTLREQKAQKEAAESEPREPVKPASVVSGDRGKFLEGVREWQQGIWTREDPTQPVPLPQPLKELARKYRLDPDDQETIDKLGDILMGVAEAAT